MKLKKLKAITECGILLAVAMALSYFRLIQLPTGGSVTLAPLPLFIIAARHKVQTGVFAGMMFGFLSLARQPYIVHPVQFLLDYPIAFATLGLAGIAEWKSIKRTFVLIFFASTFRLLCHIGAGAVFFADIQQGLAAAISFSAAYNAAYVVPETLLCAIVAGNIFEKNPDIIIAD